MPPASKPGSNFETIPNLMKKRYFSTAAIAVSLCFIFPAEGVGTDVEVGDSWKVDRGVTSEPEAETKWGGSVSSGFDSKYIFRGTNLTPHSDGVIRIDGSISLSPWDGGTFTLDASFRSQVGKSELGRFYTNRSGVPNFVAQPSGGTNFENRLPTVYSNRVWSQNPPNQERRRAISSSFKEIFENRSELRLENVLDFLAREYFTLGTFNGLLLSSPVFPIPDLPFDQFGSAADLGFGSGIEDSIRASGYRGELPSQLTRFEKAKHELTQREFRESDISFSYRQELGPVALRLTNTFSYIEQDIQVRETFREEFASNAARDFIDFESRLAIYSGGPTAGPSGAGGPAPYIFSPALPITPGHPEEVLFNDGSEATRRYRIRAEEIIDRLDLELSANTAWLLENGHAWARYLWPRVTYSHTLFSDIDTGDVTLPAYPDDQRGSYLTAELNTHLPLRRAPAEALVPVVSRSPENPLPWRDVLALDVTTLVSASFGDRPEGNGNRVRGLHHFEARAELSWWATPTIRVAPNVSYSTLFSDAIAGAEDSAIWYGVKCEYVF